MCIYLNCIYIELGKDRDLRVDLNVISMMSTAVLSPTTPLRHYSNEYNQLPNTRSLVYKKRILMDC